MNVLITACLAIGVASTWLGALALLRLPARARIHAVSFVTMAAGGAFTLAAWVSDGATSRTGKALLIWVMLMGTGALGAHVTGRAIIRGGIRR